MAIEFQREYDLLELAPADNWSRAQANYRKLVHTWHPDRYEHRPRERVHAQQQFIELTKAFNNLRAYYKENKRLPFQPIKQAVADSPEPEVHQRIRPSDATVIESSILNKRKPSTKPASDSVFKPAMWLVPALATILIGIGVFYIIDRNAKLSTIEEAKRVLRTVQPSEYVADREAISKAKGKASIVNNAQQNSGQMGDMLAKDLFK